MSDALGELQRETLVRPRREPEFLYLTTTGRRSGLLREIEIWFTRRRGRYYVISERRRGSRWVRNLLADPRVRVRVGRRRFTGRARVVDARAEPELSRTVQARSREKYGWGEGLVVELRPGR
ncbi:MAG: nitroreductase family deazaflavin-dependent oxidoreductase [Candidatus Rokubacteria bacterium]|nr:nitroreductase family deazaflavin-dependent oxidoreductase [Candidatus Rokubacteria bacterium]